MRLLDAFLRNRQATITVEFAMIAPMLILLYAGCTEIYVAFTVARKLQIVTGAANDMISQSSVVTADDLRKVFALAEVALAPFSITPVKFETTFINVDDAGNAKVEWSCGDAGSGSSGAGDEVTLPASLSALRKSHVVRTQTSYAYMPFHGYIFDRSFELGGIAYSYPRYSDKVVLSGC